MSLFFGIDYYEHQWMSENIQTLKRAITTTRKQIAAELIRAILNQSGEEEDFFDMSTDKIADICNLTTKSVNDIYNDIKTELLMSDSEQINEEYEEEGREEARSRLERLIVQYGFQEDDDDDDDDDYDYA